MASFDEIVRKMTAAIKGVREAVLGKDVREFIASGYESVLDAYKQLNTAVDSAASSAEKAKTAITEAIDPTLSVFGKAADAKATGDALETERKRIDVLNDGGLNLKDEVIDTSIKTWLTDHPEATTTVQDGAITETKIDAQFLLNIKNGYVTPQMFGALGNGVADDASAMQKMLDNVSDGTKILIPIGRYRLSRGLTINKNLQIVGESRQFGYYGSSVTYDALGSVLFFDDVSNDTMIKIQKGKASISNVSLVGNSFYFDLSRKSKDDYLNRTIFIENKIKDNVNGLECCDGVLGCWLSNFRVSGFSGFGVRLGQFNHLSGGYYNNCNIAIELNKNDCTVSDIRIGSSNTGIRLIYSSLNCVLGIRFDDIAQYPVEIIRSNNNTICEIVNDHSNYGAIKLSNSSGNTISANCGRCCEYYGGKELEDIDNYEYGAAVLMIGDSSNNKFNIKISNENLSDTFLIESCYVPIVIMSGSKSSGNTFDILGQSPKIVVDSTNKVNNTDFSKLLYVKSIVTDFLLRYINRTYYCINYNGTTTGIVSCDGVKEDFWHGIPANKVGEIAITTDKIMIWTGTEWINISQNKGA